MPCPGAVTPEADAGRLGPPVTEPLRVFPSDFDYRDDGAEIKVAVPGAPLVFSKWLSSPAGAIAEIPGHRHR
jgi:hypothetical protein